jgi:hypothetical protein
MLKTFKETIEFADDPSPVDQHIAQLLPRLKMRYSNKPFLYTITPKVTANFQDTFDHMSIIVRFTKDEPIYYETFSFKSKEPLISQLSSLSTTKKFDSILELYNKVKAKSNHKTSKKIDLGNKPIDLDINKSISTK